ncbi:hypothetical protein CITSP_05175 [Citrobacter sp. T1.2D-1]|nr:hypothetical protein CITSP_05175 [Citrobacter sp. T1.2D-1]
MTQERIDAIVGFALRASSCANPLNTHASIWLYQDAIWSERYCLACEIDTPLICIILANLAIGDIRHAFDHSLCRRSIVRLEAMPIRAARSPFLS